MAQRLWEPGGTPGGGDASDDPPMVKRGGAREDNAGGGDSMSEQCGRVGGTVVDGGVRVGRCCWHRRQGAGKLSWRGRLRSGTRPVTPLRG